MQLIYHLSFIAIFAISATAEWQHPHSRSSYQKNDLAQVLESHAKYKPRALNGTDSGSSSSSTSFPSSSSINNPTGSTASFTQYSSCNSPGSVSCAWYSSTGYNAAISQAVYGGSQGSGPSAACGVCWRLSPEYPGANEIVVKVNNLCPDDGKNPLCSMPAGEFFFGFLFTLSVACFYHCCRYYSCRWLSSGMLRLRLFGLTWSLLCAFATRCGYQFRPLSGQRRRGGPVR